MIQVSKSVPFVGMILVSFMLIGSATLNKAAMSNGLNQYVYILYSNTLGTLLLLPFFLLHSLSGKRRPLTLPILSRLFALSLLGITLSPILLVTGLKYTSVTVAASIGNLNPIFTYLIAICLRMERMDLRKSTDQIKALGTIVAVLGALVVTLYKGPALLATDDPSKNAPTIFSEQSNWQLGCILCILGFLLRSMWNIMQADTVKLYPDEVTIVFYCNLFGTLQSAVASYFLVNSQSEWRLHHKIEIISIVYSAVTMCVFTSRIVIWCVRRKGAVFVSMFEPLNVAIAGAMGCVFLAEGVYLGSVVGSATIVIGFYAVMWGQAKTATETGNKIGGLDSGCTQVAPLLQTSLA